MPQIIVSSRPHGRKHCSNLNERLSIYNSLICWVFFPVLDYFESLKKYFNHIMGLVEHSKMMYRMQSDLNVHRDSNFSCCLFKKLALTFCACDMLGFKR